MTIEEKRLKERGKRLWKNYRWTNEMYAALFELQGGKCAGCGRLPRNAPLNVDHKHFKILCNRIADGNWYAWTKVNGLEFDAVQRTKVEAVRVCKERALPYSVRGLLCPGRQRGCNRLLGRVDDVHLLENFIRYLLKPPARKIIGPHGFAETSENQDLCGVSVCHCGEFFSSGSKIVKHIEDMKKLLDNPTRI